MYELRGVSVDIPWLKEDGKKGGKRRGIKEEKEGGRINEESHPHHAYMVDVYTCTYLCTLNIYKYVVDSYKTHCKIMIDICAFTCIMYYYPVKESTRDINDISLSTYKCT